MAVDARWWASSGSMRDRTVRKRRGYIGTRLAPARAASRGTDAGPAAGQSASASGVAACATRSCAMADSKSSSESKPW